jgi:serine protease Do
MIGCGVAGRYRDRCAGAGEEIAIRRKILTLMLLTALAGCGDDSGGIVPTTAAPGTTSAPATTTTEAAGVVSGLDLIADLRARTAGTTTTVDTTPGTAPGTTAGPGPFDPGTTYTDYMVITDDSGLIELSVPVEWSDIESHGWISQGERLGPGLVAASDIEAWRAEWGTPGVFIGASDSLGQTPDTALDSKRWDPFCTYEGRDDYDDGLYVGRYDLYADCGDELSVFIVIAAEPPEGDFLIFVEIVVVTEADLGAADEIIRTFQVYGVDG